MNFKAKQVKGHLSTLIRDEPKYLANVFDSYGFDPARMPEILEIIKSQYDGYLFLPDVKETLYNSTIVTYFLKNFVLDGGEIPRGLIDDNLKTDVS